MLLSQCGRNMKIIQMSISCKLNRIIFIETIKPTFTFEIGLWQGQVLTLTLPVPGQRALLHFSLESSNADQWQMFCLGFLKPMHRSEICCVHKDAPLLASNFIGSQLLKLFFTSSWFSLFSWNCTRNTTIRSNANQCIGFSSWRFYSLDMAQLSSLCFEIYMDSVEEKVKYQKCYIKFSYHIFR